MKQPFEVYEYPGLMLSASKFITGMLAKFPSKAHLNTDVPLPNIDAPKNSTLAISYMPYTAMILELVSNDVSLNHLLVFLDLS